MSALSRRCNRGKWWETYIGGSHQWVLFWQDLRDPQCVWVKRFTRYPRMVGLVHSIFSRQDLFTTSHSGCGATSTNTQKFREDEMWRRQQESWKFEARCCCLRLHMPCQRICSTTSTVEHFSRVIRRDLPFEPFLACSFKDEMF